MSQLKEKLSAAIKVAMKSQDKNTLTFARSLHSAIRKKEIDDRVDLQDIDIEKLVSSLLKQRPPCSVKSLLISFKKVGERILRNRKS